MENEVFPEEEDSKETEETEETRTSLSKEESEEHKPGSPFIRTDPAEIISIPEKEPRLTAADFGDSDILDTLDVNEEDYELRKSEGTI